MISEDDLSAMRDRLSQATPGPWTSFIEGRDGNRGFDSFIRTAGEDIYLTGATDADQDFIAHARQDMLRLIDEVERLRRA